MGDGGRCAKSLRHRGESARKKGKVRQEEKEGSYAHTGSNLGVSKEEKEGSSGRKRRFLCSHRQQFRS